MEQIITNFLFKTLIEYYWIILNLIFILILFSYFYYRYDKVKTQLKIYENQIDNIEHILYTRVNETKTIITRLKNNLYNFRNNLKKLR
jgi:hypothetical protein